MSKKILPQRLPWALPLLRKHGVLMGILTMFAVIAGLSHSLRGSLIVGTVVTPPGGTSSSFPTLAPLRACSATGTVFENRWNFSNVEETFRRKMSAVTDERVKLLSGASRWSCLKDQEPPMPELMSMAAGLPGWYYQEQRPDPGGLATITARRPVTWNSFSAIVLEFERVYECRLAEIADRASIVVAANLDYDREDSAGNPTEFCCTEPALGAGGCVRKEAGTACATAPTTDPQCDKQCSPLISSYDLALRVRPLVERMERESAHARVTLERTLNTLRSFETNYAIARQLNCYERASVDLQNELGLLADVSSCMPRLWDVLTSLHDRKTP